ncbi:amidohydrolase family protein [Gymnodinialimonas ulvae]|uniref:amidohydrolase family protein n=1 Tax=Gymnodinialimonas ulvae TaxID=3126504 RepID=UPI0030AAA552
MTLSDLLPQGYVDTHHHVWAPQSRGEEIGYGWLRDIGAPKPFGDPTPIQRDYLMEEFLAESATPPRTSVHVQTDGALPDPVAETRFVQAEADRYGHGIRIVALADLSADDLPETLSRHAESRDFCGVRQIVGRLKHRPELSFAPRDYLTDPKWREGLKRLENKGLSFDLQMYPEQAEAALDALSATPALTVVIDHALCPYHITYAPEDIDAEGELDVWSRDDPAYKRWLKSVEMLAARPNTFIKLSGWGMYAPHWAAVQAQLIGPYMFDLLLNFGPQRIMWGSNFPVEKLATPYTTCLETVAAYLAERYREDVFINTASKAYGIKLM